MATDKSSNIDPSLIKKINEAIQQFNIISKGTTNVTRDLMAAIYMLNQGFIKTQEQFNDVINDVQEGKFNERNLKKTLQGYKVTEEHIADILDMRKSLNALTDKDIAQHRSYQRLLDLIYGVEYERYDLANNFISAFEELNSQLTSQHELAKKLSSSYGGSYEVLSKHLKKGIEIRNVFENSLIPVQELTGHWSKVSDVIDNISADKFDIGGKIFDPKGAIAYLNSISKQQLELIGEEHALRETNLKNLAATALKYTRLSDGGVFSDTKNVKLSGKAEEN